MLQQYKRHKYDMVITIISIFTKQNKLIFTGQNGMEVCMFVTDLNANPDIIYEDAIIRIPHCLYYKKKLKGSNINYYAIHGRFHIIFNENPKPEILTNDCIEESIESSSV